MNRKVLITTYYWPPSGGSGVQRFLKFCKYLPDFGVQPTVLTVSNPTYPSRDSTLHKEIPEDVPVHKSYSIEPFDLYALFTNKSKSEAANPAAPLKSGNWTAKLASWIRANFFVPDARLGWLFTARRKALEIVKKEYLDCIITTGPPHSTHLIGRYIQKKTGIRWVADFRDPWTQVYYNRILPRTQPVKQLDQYLEKKVLKYADEVIVVSPTMKKIQNRILARPYRVITNGFDPDDFRQNSGSSGQHSKQILIRHVGRISEASVPYSLFKALSESNNKEKVNLEFIGNVHQEVKHCINRYGLKDACSIKSYVPHEEAVQAMKSADLLLLVIPDIVDNELILTGKLFDYLGTQKPILYIGPKNGDAADVINNLDQGYIFSHGESSALQTFLEKVASNRLVPEVKKSYSLDNHPYSRKKLTQKLAKLI